MNLLSITMNIRDTSLPVMQLVCICTFADMNLLKHASEKHICTNGENIQESSLTACRNELFLDLNHSLSSSHSSACLLQ